MKRTPLKKISDRKKETLQTGKESTIKMWNTFLSIWYSLKPEDRKCYETGERIYGSVPGSNHFHHVLPKEKYPEYELSKWNIVLVSATTHDQVHMDMDRTPKIKALYDELLEKYINNQLTP